MVESLNFSRPTSYLDLLQAKQRRTHVNLTGGEVKLDEYRPHDLDQPLDHTGSPKRRARPWALEAPAEPARPQAWSENVERERHFASTVGTCAAAQYVAAATVQEQERWKSEMQPQEWKSEMQPQEWKWRRRKTPLPHVHRPPAHAHRLPHSRQQEQPQQQPPSLQQPQQLQAALQHEEYEAEPATHRKTVGFGTFEYTAASTSHHPERTKAGKTVWVCARVNPTRREARASSAPPSRPSAATGFGCTPSSTSHAAYPVAVVGGAISDASSHCHATVAPNPMQQVIEQPQTLAPVYIADAATQTAAKPAIVRRPSHAQPCATCASRETERSTLLHELSRTDREWREMVALLERQLSETRVQLDAFERLSRQQQRQIRQLQQERSAQLLPQPTPALTGGATHSGGGSSTGSGGGGCGGSSGGGKGGSGTASRGAFAGGGFACNGGSGGQAPSVLAPPGGRGLNGSGSGQERQLSFTDVSASAPPTCIALFKQLPVPVAPPAVPLPPAAPPPATPLPAAPAATVQVGPVASKYREASDLRAQHAAPSKGDGCYGGGRPLPSPPRASPHHQHSTFGRPLEDAALNVRRPLGSTVASLFPTKPQQTPAKLETASALVQESQNALSAHRPTRMRSSRQLFGEAFY
jgi:hypothetical protein